VSPPNSEFVDEVLRINDRYVKEVVEAFDICPYARGARTGGAVTRHVLFDDQPDLSSALHAIDAVAGVDTDGNATNGKTMIALLIFPRLDIDPAAFERFVGELRAADAARHAGRAPFAMAMFHPDAPYGTESPARLVLFFRRSPDPTIQLVRFSALDAVKGTAPSGGKVLFDWSARGFAELDRRAQELPVSDRIARDNFALIARETPARLQRIYDDIRSDRLRSYARFKGTGP
jgi:hypothetical protein